MAASLEDFVADPAEPFTPSIFLNLPPTPSPDGNGEGKNLAIDDLGLPFIERMLMEEGIDEEFFYYQYPDQPALLQAQESYARVLSDATADSSSSDGSPTVSVSSGSDDLSTDASTASEQSPAALLGDAGVRSAAAEEMDKKANSSILAVVDGDHAAALASALLSAQQDEDGGSKAMLNLAFLKGMEEANKFLPREIDLLRATVVQVKEEEESVNCRGRKNRHNRDDVLEARESKMMAPGLDESGEVVDEMIANGFQLFFREMEGLRISMSSEAEKKKSRKRSANGAAVDLCTLLMHCAQAMATDDRRSAAELLRKIKKHSSPRGDATQRLAHYFAEGFGGAAGWFRELGVEFGHGKTHFCCGLPQSLPAVRGGLLLQNDGVQVRQHDHFQDYCYCREDEKEEGLQDKNPENVTQEQEPATQEVQPEEPGEED